MSKNEPDSPGIVIPHILIKPQKNTNNTQNNSNIPKKVAFIGAFKVPCTLP